mmetsp:Transcript_15721/g.31623  ORF Transcript_15721/g.31623 Transcript_15721/m.31623 type:complete len:211 (+) Transcript_15721:1856-2488(+)
MCLTHTPCPAWAACVASGAARESMQCASRVRSGTWSHSARWTHCTHSTWLTRQDPSSSVSSRYLATRTTYIRSTTTHCLALALLVMTAGLYAVSSSPSLTSQTYWSRVKLECSSSAAAPRRPLCRTTTGRCYTIQIGSYSCCRSPRRTVGVATNRSHSMGPRFSPSQVMASSFAPPSSMAQPAHRRRPSLNAADAPARSATQPRYAAPST